jgi:hypothetical protein
MFKWRLLVNSDRKVGHTFSRPDPMYRCLTPLSLLLRFIMVSPLLREIETIPNGRRRSFQSLDGPAITEVDASASSWPDLTA